MFCFMHWPNIANVTAYNCVCQVCQVSELHVREIAVCLVYADRLSTWLSDVVESTLHRLQRTKPSQYMHLVSNLLNCIKILG